ALAYFADTFFEDRTAFPIAREALQREIGDAALVDAAGVLAIYDAVVKIADATGIPLEEAKAEMSADFREDLGINDYPSAEGRI
ncbi:MAG: alkylhydroperoxidase-related (seleno)protein, partial [Rhodospirillaceae bacterium]|nr:alkylhydroperoxidase-related (seleno)protein [Rhodospirillaceae bacterium]